MVVRRVFAKRRLSGARPSLTCPWSGSRPRDVYHRARSIIPRKNAKERAPTGKQGAPPASTRRKTSANRLQRVDFSPENSGPSANRSTTASSRPNRRTKTQPFVTNAPAKIRSVRALAMLSAKVARRVPVLVRGRTQPTDKQSTTSLPAPDLESHLFRPRVETRAEVDPLKRLPQNVRDLRTCIPPSRTARQNVTGALEGFDRMDYYPPTRKCKAREIFAAS